MSRISLFKKPMVALLILGFLFMSLFFIGVFSTDINVAYGEQAVTISFGNGTQIFNYSERFFSESLVKLDGKLKLLGTIKGDTFTVGEPSVDSGIEYYLIIDSEKFKTVDGERILDANGRIVLTPEDASYEIGFFNLYLEEAVFLYKKEGENETELALSGSPQFKVAKKKISVAVDEQYKNEDASKELDYIIERTYGDEALSALSFTIVDADTQFPFGETHGHKLECTGEFIGNEQYADVGTYLVEIDQSSEGVKIKDGNNVDVTNCYDINCDQTIGIVVSPREVYFPEITAIEEEFPISEGEINSLKSFELEFDGNKLEGFKDLDDSGSFKFSIGYSTVLAEGDGFKVGGEYSYTPSIIGIKRNDDEISSDNFSFKEVVDGSYKKTIVQKNILIYLEGEEPSAEQRVNTKLPIKKEDFSEFYGKAYKETEEYNLNVETIGVTLRVTYSIDGYNDMKNKEGARITDDGLIVDVGEYSLVNVTAENTNFKVTVDKSLKLTIAKATLSLDVLAQGGSLKVVYGENVIDLTENGYNFLTKAYKELPSGESSYTLSFKNTISGKDFDYSAGFYVDIEEGLPGVYNSKNYSCEQYIIDGIEKLSITVSKASLSLSLADKEYDGEKYTSPQLSEKAVEGLVLNYDYSYKNSKGTAISGEPTDAGSYKLFFELKEGSENLYTFNGQSSLEIPFKINPRPVTVDAELKSLANGKPFGQSVSVDKLVTVSIRHTNNKDEIAVIGNKELVTVSCDGAKENAKPGKYSIEFTANSKISSNYQITYAQKNLKMTVSKTDLSALKKSGALKVGDWDVIATKDSIGLGLKKLYSASLEGYLSIEYRLYDEENVAEWIAVSGLVADSGLEEGAKYQIRYVLSKDNPYVELSEDFKSEESGYIVIASTKIDIPIISEGKIASKEIAIVIDNYDVENSYSWIIGFEGEEGYDEQEYPMDNSLVEGEEIFSVKLSRLGIELVPDTQYTITLKRLGQNEELFEQSESLVITTAREKPLLKKGEFEIGQNTIGFYKADEGDEDPQFVYYYILLDRGHTNIESSTDAENPEMSKYFSDAEYSELVKSGEGYLISELEADCIYAVKIAFSGTEEKPESEAVYFAIHTSTESAFSVATTGLINTISRYLLSGGAVLFFVLFIIVVIRYAVIGKRLRRRVK